VVGLALHDISKVLLHGDEDEEVVQHDQELVPEWIKKSPLREKHIKRLLNRCPPDILEKPAVDKPS
jgi:hypothetical protein